MANAQSKLQRKGCDWIVANDVSPQSGVMGGDRNTVHILSRAENEIQVNSWPVMGKDEVATALVARKSLKQLEQAREFIRDGCRSNACRTARDWNCRPIRRRMPRVWICAPRFPATSP